jgi:mannitol-specific phosphotransferase system IIBC component
MTVLEASITGVFRTVLIIVGALVVIRFIGQLMLAKKNLAEEKELNKQQKAQEAEKRRKKKNLGRTQILKKQHTSNDGIEDIDFEEVD